MASTSETGHAKNVANFEDLISFCTGYGTAYNPNKASIKLPTLNTQLTSGKNSLTTINTLLPPSTNAINARDIVFSPLNKLITRVMNAVAESNVPKTFIADAKTIARKLQGKRGSDKLPTIVDDPNTPEDESQKSISASQMSFDQATGTGLVDTAGDVKKYVKSVFGGTSPQYKQVSGLKFTKVGK